MASTRIYRTSGTPTSTKKFTLSFWLKKSATGADQFVFNTTTDANNRSQVEFNTDDEINFICKVSGSNIGRLRTTRKFRDTAAFYHIVAVLDTTELTSSNRMKLYVNGVQETNFITETYPSQDADANVSGTHTIGSYYNGSSPSNYLDGLLTHVHFTDGYAYQASTFGETDTTSGIWKPKTAPSVTYGTNGFFLKFENSGAMGTDSSGNSNTFTPGGTLTQNIDTPTNNFCTCNSLITDSTNNRFSHGNTTYDNAGSYQSHAQGTLGMQSGKWYWEIKMNNTHGQYGVCENYVKQAEDPQGSAPYYFIYSNGSNGVVVYNNATGSSPTTNSSWTNFASGQIIGVAYDADNGKLYFHNNGVYYNSGDPAAGTGEVISGITPREGGIIVPLIAQGTGNGRIHNCNWGQGYFGTTAVSSANADDNGIGSFEYDVPAGYYALCTKNLKEFS